MCFILSLSCLNLFYDDKISFFLMDSGGFDKNNEAVCG